MIIFIKYQNIMFNILTICIHLSDNDKKIVI